MDFNLHNLVVSAGSSVTIIFHNGDAGVVHNFALYTGSSAATLIFRGASGVGPATTTYVFDAPTVGTYFFRDDNYPAMQGTLVVQ